MADLAALAPAVMAAAREGDEVAVRIVDRQAAEVVSFARASLTRLGMLDREIPVVLGGGVIRAGDERLMAGIEAGLAADAPLARIVRVDAPPIVGAGLLALESAGATRPAIDRARAELTAAYEKRPRHDHARPSGVGGDRAHLDDCRLRGWARSRHPTTRPPHPVPLDAVEHWTSTTRP